MLLAKQPRLWNLRRYDSAGNSVLILIGFSPTLLARRDLRTTRELRASIFEKYYFYFSNKYKEARHNELSDLAYYTHWVYVVLAFNIAMRGKAFLSNRLPRDREVLKELVNTLTIEPDRYLEKLQWEFLLVSGYSGRCGIFQVSLHTGWEGEIACSGCDKKEWCFILNSGITM